MAAAMYWQVNLQIIDKITLNRIRMNHCYTIDKSVIERQSPSYTGVSYFTQLNHYCAANNPG